jgi:sulfur carrier protein ThiS
MSVTLHPVGHLRSYVDGKDILSMPAGMSIRDTLQAAGIPPELVALVVVNEVYQTDKEILLRDGDDVRVMAVIGGG